MAKATIAEIRKAILKELPKDGGMSSNRSCCGDTRCALIEFELVGYMAVLPCRLL